MVEGLRGVVTLGVIIDSLIYNIDVRTTTTSQLINNPITKGFVYNVHRNSFSTRLL